MRPWHVGVLYNEDDRAARVAIPLLEAEGLMVGDQEPYSGRLLNATMNRHAEAEGRPYLRHRSAAGPDHRSRKPRGLGRTPRAHCQSGGRHRRRLSAGQDGCGDHFRPVSTIAVEGAGTSLPNLRILVDGDHCNARLSFQNHHPRPQHGRRARPVARHGHEGQRFRQADHRRGQLLHPVRAGPCPPQGPRPARGARDRGGRRRCQGIQHHRGR